MTDCNYARIRHGDAFWIDTRQNSTRFIVQCWREGDDDYEVTNISITREQYEALPEFTGP